MAEHRVRGGTHEVVGLSRDDLDRATLGMTAQHPLTLYTAGAGMLGILATAVLGPSAALLGLAVGGVGIGTGSWIVNYFFRNERFARRYLEKLHAEMEGRRREALERVRSSLDSLAGLEGAEEYADQGREQLEKVQEKFGNLRELLRSKLSPSELTYARYFGTAEQVVLTVLDSLQDVVGFLESVRTIDGRYVRSRLQALERQKSRSPADEQEVGTLEARMKLREEQLEKVNVLLTRNEEAMTSLDQTIAAIAAMKTVQGQATVDMETARQQLEELAKRSQQYSLT